ncbi:MAG TPA: bifunctional oligoribonuclease/PAP phosphatase NrnA [Spirochaetota bacterium]|nr:bifunctional oligoribonuclease/PAP phosphatase NrnA [Spirochaetota bacterium]
MNRKYKILNKLIKENSKILKIIKKEIKKAKKIAVIGHVNPDGDCIGSQLALAEALKLLHKEVTCINEGEFETEYAKMFKDFFKTNIEYKDYDLYIIVDTSSKSRIGNLEKDVDFSKSIVIDHHLKNANFGKINWVAEDFISCSEMIFLLFYYLKIDLSKNNINQFLLNGILSDNGYFQHIRINKFFSLFASYYLIESGANPKKSYDIMFCNNTLETEKLFSLVLSRISYYKTENLVWTYLLYNDKKENAEISSGMIFREMMSLKNVKISVYFKTYEDGKVSISFRSTDDINVAKIAEFFGGGGHKVASGASLYGDFEEIKDKVLNKAYEELSIK